MARKKSIIRLPFLKTKINAKTLFLLCSLVMFFGGFLLLLSLLPLGPSVDGRALAAIRFFLVERFGFVSYFVPVFIILGSVHLFSVSRKEIIRPTITVGLFFIFVSIGSLFRGGSWGQYTMALLQESISPIGTFLFLLTLLFIGIILFFDTSIELIIKTVGTVVVGLFAAIKKSADPALHPVKTKEDGFVTDKKLAKGKEQKPIDFIEDVKSRIVNPAEKKQSEPVQQTAREQQLSTASQDIYIKPLTQSGSTWIFPPLNLLSDVKQAEADRGDVNYIASTIEKTLDSFGIAARVAEHNKGPAVTQYGIEIKSGTRLSKITALANDLALAIAAPTGQVRIEAPIPGRSMVGIEIPNIRPQIVTLKSLLQDDVFTKNPDPLLVPLGLDVSGRPQAASIGKMPHCLIAGTTGSGKSVIINAWISTFLFRTRPEDLRLILVDPKRVEMSSYNSIPHLLTPVINEPEMTLRALRWTVNEMQERYKIFAKVHARNIESYNQIPGVEKKPFIIFMIDELADLMMFAGNDVEALITRIAQLARATGIHLVLATQRPSVDVITGLMKANIPARLAFNVSSMIDSRVIIDMPGAEKLLGKGDMLFLPPDQAKPRRIQGPFITEKEVLELTKFIRAQSPEVHYTEEIMETDPGVNAAGMTGSTGGVGGGQDPLFNQALDVIQQSGKASTSYLQRKLKIGYSRAAAIIDELETAGYVGPATGSGKPREVLKRNVSPDVEVAV
jgi:S-DNA-T family DNA segregation ATPase FtsK/SpoIIIE